MTTFTSSRQTEIHRVLREMRVRLYTTDINITAKNITNKKKRENEKFVNLSNFYVKSIESKQESLTRFFVWNR